jgi:hypothetical protein
MIIKSLMLMEISNSSLEIFNGLFEFFLSIFHFIREFRLIFFECFFTSIHNFHDFFGSSIDNPTFIHFIFREFIIKFFKAFVDFNRIVNFFLEFSEVIRKSYHVFFEFNEFFNIIGNILNFSFLGFKSIE